MFKRMCFYIILLLILVCAAMSGCETGEDIVDPTDEPDIPAAPEGMVLIPAGDFKMGSEGARGKTE